MYFQNNFNTPITPAPPTNGVSVTVPGQAPMLKYIIGALKRGESLNIKLSMSYDNAPKFGDMDLNLKDLKHLTSSDIDAYLSTYSTEANPINTEELAK